MTPYFLMALLYLSLAALATLGLSLAGLSSFFSPDGLRGIGTHLIIFGVSTQVIFGILPVQVALYHRLPYPAFRWAVWLPLNIGILTLLLLLTGRLSLNAAVERVTKRLNITGRAIIWDYAEPAMDVDKPHQLEILRADLEALAAA